MRRADPSTFVISITPFTQDGRLDEDGLRGHLRRLGAAGVGVYLGGSGSGEGYTLDPGEARRVLEIGAEELGGRVPVRAMGVEPRTASQMIEYARLVGDVGLEATQVYSLDQGHGSRPSDDELRRYLTTVLDESPVPCVLSSHQSVGYWIPADLLGWLLDRYDNLIGVNCTSPDVSYLRQVIDTVDGRATVHTGGPMHALTCLALGGDGYLSSEGNLAPRLCTSVVERYGADDLSGCADAFRTLMRVFDATRRRGGIVATKAVLHELGLPGGFPRPPRLPVADALRPQLVAEIVDAFGLRDSEDLRP